MNRPPDKQPDQSVTFDAFRPETWASPLSVGRSQRGFLVVEWIRGVGWLRVSRRVYESRLAAENDLDLFGNTAQVVPDHPRWWE